jgi:AraC-like DNA-binding protein
MSKLVKEITTLTHEDCFKITSRVKNRFDYPLHFHEEFELNYIENGKGARRVIGNHIQEIDDLELVLVGSNLQHAWFGDLPQSQQVHEITLQFHKDLFEEKLLKRNQLGFIRQMLDKSLRGILFSRETTLQIAPRIKALHQKYAFDSVLELFSILNDLSTSRNMISLSDPTFTNNESHSFKSRRIETAFEYMRQNFDKPISLSDVAKLVHMTDPAFSRFFKDRAGINFIDSLTDIRLGHASRLLVDTTQSIGEIAFHSGFNNISNFNRIFKKKKNITPKDYREHYSTSTGIYI